MEPNIGDDAVNNNDIAAPMQLSEALFAQAVDAADFWLRLEISLELVRDGGRTRVCATMMTTTTHLSVVSTRTSRAR